MYSRSLKLYRFIRLMFTRPKLNQLIWQLKIWRLPGLEGTRVSCEGLCIHRASRQHESGPRVLCRGSKEGDLLQRRSLGQWRGGLHWSTEEVPGGSGTNIIKLFLLLLGTVPRFWCLIIPTKISQHYCYFVCWKLFKCKRNKCLT